MISFKQHLNEKYDEQYKKDLIKQGYKVKFVKAIGDDKEVEFEDSKSADKFMKKMSKVPHIDVELDSNVFVKVTFK